MLRAPRNMARAITRFHSVSLYFSSPPSLMTDNNVFRYSRANLIFFFFSFETILWKNYLSERTYRKQYAARILPRIIITRMDDVSSDREENLNFSVFARVRVADADHRSSCRRIDVVPEDVSCVCETRKRPIDVQQPTVMERDIVS